MCLYIIIRSAGPCEIDTSQPNHLMLRVAGAKELPVNAVRIYLKRLTRLTEPEELNRRAIPGCDHVCGKKGALRLHWLEAS